MARSHERQPTGEKGDLHSPKRHAAAAATSKVDAMQIWISRQAPRYSGTGPMVELPGEAKAEAAAGGRAASHA